MYTCWQHSSDNLRHIPTNSLTIFPTSEKSEKVVVESGGGGPFLYRYRKVWLAALTKNIILRNLLNMDILSHEKYTLSGYYAYLKLFDNFGLPMVQQTCHRLTYKTNQCKAVQLNWLCCRTTLILTKQDKVDPGLYFLLKTNKNYTINSTKNTVKPV